MSDGAVIIDTRIDNTGLKQAIDKLNEAVDKFANNTQKGLDSVDKSLKNTGKEAKKLKIEPTTEGINQAVRELDILNAKIENQESLLSGYQREYKRVAERFGETSEQALNLEKKILSAESAIEKMTKQSDKMAGAIADAEEAMKDGAKAADKLGEGGKKSKKGLEEGGKGASTFQVALGELIASGIKKAISSIQDLIEKTSEYRKDMSFLKQNALDAGMGMDAVNSSMQKAFVVSGELDSSIEAVSNLLAAGFNENGMEKALNAIIGAAIKFPDTLKIESLADSLQETIATGEASGQFIEMLGRMGVDTEKFSERMEKARTATTRQNIVLETLAKTGLAESAEGYRENNKELIENAEAQYEYQQSLAELGALLEPIKTGIVESLTDALSDNKDLISDIVKVVGGAVTTFLRILDVISGIPTPLLLIGGALLGLVITIGQFSISFVIASKAMSTGARTLSSAGGAAMKAGTQFALLTLEILAIAAAIALVITSIALLVSAINGVPAIMVNSELTKLPSTQGLKGYAKGTRSASPGYSLVAESGQEYVEGLGLVSEPSLVRFRGGEEIMNATQTAAMRGNIGKTNSYVYNDNSQYIFKVDDIGTYIAIEKRLKNERMSIRQGVV